MSIAIPSINSNLKFEISNTGIELNTLSQDFNEVYSFTGYGNLINATFKLSRPDAIFKLQIDDNIVCELDITVLSSIANTINDRTKIPIIYDANDRLLSVKFDTALHYSKNINFFFKRNNNTGGNNNRVQLEGYAISIIKEGGL